VTESHLNCFTCWCCCCCWHNYFPTHFCV